MVVVLPRSRPRTTKGEWTMKIIGCVAAAGLVSLLGCSAASEDSAPDVAEGALGVQATITYDGWTATSLAPSINEADLASASAEFTGPTNATRKLGVCLLVLTSKPCTDVVADCGQLDGAPKLAARYCAQPDGFPQKYCAWRPGTQTEACAGSPALPGNPAVGAGTYTTPIVQAEAWQELISYACFGGCLGTTPEPSVSSTSQAVDDYFCNKYPNYPSCQPVIY